MGGQELNKIRDNIRSRMQLEELSGYRQRNGHFTQPLEQDIAMYNEIVRSHAIRDDFMKWVYDYKIDKVGENYSGRYCVAISVDDILQKIDELELKHANLEKE